MFWTKAAPIVAVTEFRILFLISNTDLWLLSSTAFCEEITIFILVTIKDFYGFFFIIHWKPMTDSRLYTHPQANFWSTGYIHLHDLWEIYSPSVEDYFIRESINQVLCYLHLFLPPWHCCHILEHNNQQLRF